MPSPADLASLVSSSLAEAGLDLIVEHDEGSILISGVVTTEAEHEAALDIARSVAGDSMRVDESIEVTGAVPDEVGGRDLADGDVAGFTGATPGLEDPESAIPGDFTDQPSIDTPADAQPMSLSDDGRPMGEDVLREAEEGETYVPPTDPVGTDTEILGGTGSSSMDGGNEPARSSDGTIGDEALREAVTRALREDAATAGIQVTVTVTSGIVTLSGEVPDLVDAENAEEVAARVSGVVEVRERTSVAGLSQEGKP